MKAVTCPVCTGTGETKIKHPNIRYNPLPKCHGCDGKGWIEVHENNCEKYIIHEYPEWPPYYPRPYLQYEPYWDIPSETVCLNWVIK